MNQIRHDFVDDLRVLQWLRLFELICNIKFVTRFCPETYMESTYLQSDLTVKVKMRTYIRLFIEGATF